MDTLFLIDGGAGRVVTAIPALQKFHKQNPDDDFRVLVAGFDQFFWSHPILQNRTLPQGQRNSFQDLIRSRRVVHPEPYQLHSFFNQKTNLVQAFDEIINNTTDHSDLDYLCLTVGSHEKKLAQAFVQEKLQQKQRKKAIAFQPFGSGAQLMGDDVVDFSNRSMSRDCYFEIAQRLSDRYLIFFIGQPELRHPQDDITVSFDEQQPYLRVMMSLINECDAYLGICSVGQHVARAFGKPGVIVMGGTDERNFSYSDHFTIYRRDKNFVPAYAPWRLSDVDNEFANRYNDTSMDFKHTDWDKICGLIDRKTKDIPDRKIPFINRMANPGCQMHPMNHMPLPPFMVNPTGFSQIPMPKFDGAQENPT